MERTTLHAPWKKVKSCALLKYTSIFDIFLAPNINI